MRFLPLILLSLVLAIFAHAAKRLPPGEVAIMLAIALASWPMAYLSARRVAGAGARRLERAATLRWAALFPSLGLAVFALVTLLSPDAALALGTALGLVIAGATFAAAAWLWLLPLRPIFALQAVLEDPERARPAAEALVRSFERSSSPTRGIALRRHAQRALAAVGVLSEARRFEEARRVLDRVHTPGLDPLRRSALEASRAMVLLYAGDRNGAWVALRNANEHARDPIILRILTVTFALITALDGHGDEALARLAEVPEPAEPRLRRAWLLAKSHALAARGDSSAAHAALKELANLSPDGLERAALLNGPASELARELARRRA
jgi:hypothetical protein